MSRHKGRAADKLWFEISALFPGRAVREYRFHSKRRWRFDFAFVPERLAVEVEGVVYEGKGKSTRLDGRHVRPKGFEADCEKYAEAWVMGWSILRVTPRMINRGEAIGYIQARLDQGGEIKARLDMFKYGLV